MSNKSKLRNPLARLRGLRSKKTSIVPDRLPVEGVPDTGVPVIRGKGEGFLTPETKRMDRDRRLLEQRGHQQFTKVHARDHTFEDSASSPEGEMQNDILQHPWLDGQRFDGIDPTVNPAPPLNSAARREFDNQRRDQEHEKQLSLGLAPGYTPPKLKPPGAS